VAVLLQGWRSAAGGTRWVACRMVAVPSVAAAADTPGAIEVDTLTGLPNRASLRPRLQAALAEAHDRGQMAALILLDLDHFKQLNDTQGHEAGDALLVEVAQRLRGLLRPHDTVARLGGDEFVLLLTELADDHEAAADAAQRIARKALDAVALPFSHEGGEFLATASLGLCMCSGAETVSALLQQADLAMYAAKRAGRGRVAVFDRAMQQAATAEVVLDQELSKALRRGQLHLNYQPQVNHGGAVHGAEVLLRWRHARHGLARRVHPGSRTQRCHLGYRRLGVGASLPATAAVGRGCAHPAFDAVSQCECPAAGAAGVRQPGGANLGSPWPWAGAPAPGADGELGA
jgi:diguanylate cyclase (GGDEF)-like protein